MIEVAPATRRPARFSVVHSLWLAGSLAGCLDAHKAIFVSRQSSNTAIGLLERWPLAGGMANMRPAWYKMTVSPP